MKTNIACETDSILGRTARAAVRFGLRKTGALLRAATLQAIRTAERLEALSEHPKLKSPPFFHV